MNFVGHVQKKLMFEKKESSREKEEAKRWVVGWVASWEEEE